MCVGISLRSDVQSFFFGCMGVFFSPLAVPSLTFPFCFATTLFVLMQGSLPNIVPIPLPEITSPEGHLRRANLQLKVINKMRQQVMWKKKQRNQKKNENTLMRFVHRMIK